MCGGPDGAGTCIYVMCCWPCAAGEIAAAAGRSYAMTCCVCPMLCPCCLPGHLAQDREEFAKKHHIADDLGCLGACFLNWLGCTPCLLCQEYATLRAYVYGTGAAPLGVGPTTVIVTPQQQYMYTAVPAAPV